MVPLPIDPLSTAHVGIHVPIFVQHALTLWTYQPTDEIH